MERKNGKGARMAAVIRDYEEGLTVKEISEKRSLAINTVKEYLRMHKRETASEYAKKRTEEAGRRTEIMAQEYASGMSTQEIADKHGIDRTSVTLALRLQRTEGVDLDVSYKQLFCTSKTSAYIKEWSKGMAGRILRTPDGEMAILRVHKNGVMLCGNLRQDYKTTFMAWQLYYMNAR